MNFQICSSSTISSVEKKRGYFLSSDLTFFLPPNHLLLLNIILLNHCCFFLLTNFLHKLHFWLLSFVHITGSYLLVITERECVGSYLGHPIFRVTALQILPCNHSLTNISAEQVQKFVQSYLCICLFQVYNPSQPALMHQTLTEKVGSWFFCSPKCCRENSWSVLLLWCQLDAQVSNCCFALLYRMLNHWHTTENSFLTNESYCRCEDNSAYSLWLIQPHLG